MPAWLVSLLERAIVKELLKLLKRLLTFLSVKKKNDEIEKKFQEVINDPKKSPEEVKDAGKHLLED